MRIIGQNGCLNSLKEKIILHGQQFGFRELKVIPAEPLPFFDAALAQRIAGDAEAEKVWKQKKIRSDPRELLPGAHSLWAAIYPYAPYPKRFPSGMGVFNAHYRYYPEGRDKMERLAYILKEAGYRAAVNPLLPIKAFARQAGLGYYGKNGLLIHPEYGSYITLHIMLTDAVFTYDHADSSLQQLHSGCCNCDRCIKVCPFGAIGEGGTVDLLKCMRHYMFSEEVVPESFRAAMKTQMLGCEICQRCCPLNAKCGINTAAPMEELTLFNIFNILKNHKDNLQTITEQAAQLVGRNYARAQQILSAAVIAAGNSKNPAYIPLLQETLNHHHRPIQVHSAWALAKLQGNKEN